MEIQKILEMELKEVIQYLVQSHQLVVVLVVEQELEETEDLAVEQEEAHQEEVVVIHLLQVHLKEMMEIQTLLKNVVLEVVEQVHKVDLKQQVELV
tara:strand:- start:171 stop:458 length:288 start_codon:yes stop_codon:yes gene_type:complete